MMLAEIFYVTPHIFFQIVQSILMKINVKFHYISTKIKDFMKGGMLGLAKFKIMHHRGNLEIGNFKYPKTKH